MTHPHHHHHIHHWQHFPYSVLVVIAVIVAVALLVIYFSEWAQDIGSRLNFFERANLKNKQDRKQDPEVHQPKDEGQE